MHPSMFIHPAQPHHDDETDGRKYSLAPAGRRTAHPHDYTLHKSTTCAHAAPEGPDRDAGWTHNSVSDWPPISLWLLRGKMASDTMRGKVARLSMPKVERPDVEEPHSESRR